MYSSKTFQEIILKGDVDAAKEMVLTGKATFVNDYNKDKHSYLFIAASCGHVSMCQYLIALGAEINPRYYLPLSIALYNGHKDLVHLLVSCGALNPEKYYNESCYDMYYEVVNERAILTLISSRRTRAVVCKIPTELYVVLYSFLK